MSRAIAPDAPSCRSRSSAWAMAASAGGASHSRSLSSVAMPGSSSGVGDGGFRRRVQPFEIAEPRAHRGQQQRRGGEVFAENLGRGVRGTPDKVVEWVKPDSAAGTGAPGAAGPLIRARLADARDLQ